MKSKAEARLETIRVIASNPDYMYRDQAALIASLAADVKPKSKKKK